MNEGGSQQHPSSATGDDDEAQSSLFYADLRKPFVPAMKTRKPAPGSAPALTWSVDSPPSSVAVGAFVTKYGQRFVLT